MISQRLTGTNRGSFAPDTATRIFPGHVALFRLKMNRHGFTKTCDHKYLFDHYPDRFGHRVHCFDHRFGKRCSTPGCTNTLADWSTFKSAARTVPKSHPHSRAGIKSNTHSYGDSEPDTITKPSTCWNAPPTFTPPQIALPPVHVMRVYDAGGNVIETHEHKGDFKEW